VRFDSGNVDNVDEVIQCNAAAPENGLALGGGVWGDSDTDALNPTVELSAPVNADGERITDEAEQATGWIGRIDWNTARTFTVYVICAAP
jgi:hypothetical protein